VKRYAEVHVGGKVRRRRVVKCCGADLVCRDFTNTCSRCGADYNMSGQRLAPRTQWGAETGEHWSDCIGPFDDTETF